MHYPAESNPAATSLEETREDGRTPRGGYRGRLRAWHVAGVVLLLAVGGLLLYGFWPVLMGSGEEDARPEVSEADVGAAQVEVVRVEATDFPLRAEATGYLAPWRRTRVTPEVNGRVVARPAEEGQRVAAGSLLYALDDREYRIALEEAEAEVLTRRAEFAVAMIQDSDLAPSDTTLLTQQRLAWEEAQQAHASGSLSESELHQARRRYEAAQILTGNRRADVQAATTGLAQAEQALERAQLDLERTRVSAPFAGRIADLNVEEGQRVAPGDETVLLLDDVRMKVDVDVLEADLVRIQEGATARVRIPSLGNEVFEGIVHAVNPLIEEGRGTGRVTVAIPNPDGRLVSGLYAYVEVERERLQERLVVPADAVLVRQGRDLVFRVRDGRAEWVYVTTGARSGDYVEITEGIETGDTVAVYGHHELAHDARVEVAAVRGVFDR